jgi:hypothetical protein
MIIRKFQPEDLKLIDIQPAQSLAEKHLGNTEYIKALAAADSWTCMLGDRVVACCGIAALWPGRSQAWALISATIGPAGMVQLTRAVKKEMEKRSDRIEFVVSAGFTQGQRWAEILGFTLETPSPMRKWFPEGGDAYLYSKVK